ncbi:MAG: hypothetical protein WCF17_07600 [Terracidiphilus sp.]
MKSRRSTKSFSSELRSKSGRPVDDRPPIGCTGSTFDSFLEEEGILEEVDAAAIKRVLAWQLARADANEGIRQGLDDAKRGRMRPAREFFAEFEATHGLSR